MTDFVDVHADNAAAWNQTSDWYRDKIAGALPGLRFGGVTLHPVETQLLKSLGDMSTWCDRAIHLQCAAGLDSVSLANFGAQSVLGIDIADELVDLATSLAAQLGKPVTFRCSDVLDPPAGLAGTADLVYTGKGAVHWMFDIKRWGQVVARLLRPGGWFMLFDFHPMMWLFRGSDTEMTPSGVSYFAPVISYREWPEQHVGALVLPPSEVKVKKLRPWPPSAVIQSLLDAGLDLKSFGEYPDTINAASTAYPQWQPENRRKVATMYSVLARKPE
ncbi:class I SAM-dependent methyltransferase [Amycolatopsis sp. NBC_01480]|uniref:class I SAM-dependent methyltransferase n=1 Tax=Amycolatopsis sp. NBC_01480 TaxID=2903562 RepID=UPI002E2AC064|nr:class I SAM-dependent methyltransferase [Amycolatopsis sp. NBC_01480]